ncbi:unnamed protein product [Toxocara canis]|uniref:RRM domain-containing protein n=1 Tax=Toxocara canis TaxID=6265 RepID=A0A183USE7_TOXCA|nr:unnamed protein product [Toxocara canis]
MSRRYSRTERSVRVSGMHHLIDSDFIYDLFSLVGLVEKVVVREYRDGSPRNALVVFKDIESVMHAMKYLHKMDVFGEQIFIHPLR